MISRDPNTLRPGTPAYQRMEEYRALVDRLDITLPRSLGAYLFRRYDVVTVQDPFETGLLAFLYARCIGARIELQIHTDFCAPAYAAESLKNRIRVAIASLLLPRADCIRVVSPRIQHSLLRRFTLTADPVVLSIFVDVSKYANESPRTDLHRRYPQFSRIILMASRISREKNISLALRAFARVHARIKDAGLVIVGSGPMLPMLKNEARRLSIADAVVFEPWTHDIASYYKTADLFFAHVEL